MRTLFIATALLFALSGCCGKTGGNTGNGEEAAAATQKATTMIRLNVAVTAKADHLDEVIAGLNELAAASRAEAGCEGYWIYQSTIDPTSLIIVETWAGDAALSAHQQTPHYTTILPPLGDKMTLKLERFDY
ncbi:MAG: antibiotic biosynthesis monooxygenase [Alistipes sp.]|jgi:quinol monooxygenase YgiN|nr:antibiotic biosynthesis monooxygenase [Alistipes sp.]